MRTGRFKKRDDGAAAVPLFRQPAARPRAVPIHLVAQVHHGDFLVEIVGFIRVAGRMGSGLLGMMSEPTPWLRGASSLKKLRARIKRMNSPHTMSVDGWAMPWRRELPSIAPQQRGGVETNSR